MTMRKKFVLVLILGVLFTAVLAGPSAAQSGGNDESVLVRVNGDVTVPTGEMHGVVVVVDGDLRFAGTATTVVVVNGTAELTGATVTDLVVVSGTANLAEGTVVSGDVHLIDTTLTQDPSSTVEGTITRGAGGEFTSGFWILGLLFMIGWVILALLAGLLLAGVAPELARRAGRTVTSDILPTIIAGLILWIVVPIVGALLFATIVGIPTAVTIWLLALPLLGFVGFLVAGIRIGEYITARGGGVGHPYLASFVGLLALVIVGAVPFVGPLIVAVAGFAGSGALALHAYRAIRDQPRTIPPPPQVAPVAPTSMPAAPN
jgi:hypothetical protein